MVGSRQMQRVLFEAREAGAKVVLVGDPEQLQAIEAGAALRALVERHGAAEITSVRRQASAWQRAATRELASEKTALALARYEAAGLVQAHGTRDEAKAALVAGWDERRRAAPSDSAMILAPTRADVRELNALARARLREAGELGPDAVVQTERGERAFAAGDRIMFLRNERSLGVKNGTLGTLEEIAGGSLVVRLDGDEGARVRFELKDYAALDHGYAATIHKAQGVTVERTHVLATPPMDRHAAYVALTRHRDGVALHWAREDFGDRAGLDRALSRERSKDTTLDYQAGFAERRGIVPHSEILLRRAPEQSEAAPRVRRGMFAGLRFGAGADRVESSERAGPTPRTAAERDPASVRLGAAVAGYTRAFADAERMRTAGLPVLPHQEEAFARADARLQALDRGTAEDLRMALERAPALAGSLKTHEDKAALMEAVAHERQVRLTPELRAERYVETWTRLSTERKGLDDWGPQGERRAALEDRLRQLAGALKRDPAAERVMKDRATEFGIAAGSRLYRVLEAPDAREAERLVRGLGRGLGR
jgi:hypothetical protein